MLKKFLEAGKIVNTHGVKGEVKIQPWADSACFLKSFRVFYIDGAACRVNRSYVHKDMLIAAFEGVEDINAAAALKNRIVFIDRDDAHLPENKFFIQDILGASVVDESGTEIGKLVDIIFGPAQNVYVVKGETEHLIPAVPEFILNVDTENARVTVHMIDGM